MKSGALRPSQSHLSHLVLPLGILLSLGAFAGLALDAAARSPHPRIADDTVTAAKLLDEGSVDEAVAIYEAILAASPEDAKALVGMGRAMIMYDDMDEATRFLESVLNRDPAHPGANLYLGVALYYKARRAVDEGKISGYVGSLFKDSRAALDKALAANPDNLEALQYLGLVCYWQQDFAGAVASFERALAIDDKDAFSEFQLGEVYSVQQEYEKAIGHYERAVKIEPQYAEAHRKLGICHEFLQNYDAAEAAYRDAILASPDYLDPYKDIWRIYTDEAYLAQGASAMRKLLRDLPDQYQVHWYLGHFLARAKNNSQAIRAFERVLELNPASIDVYLEVATVLISEKKYSKAVEHLQKGLEAARREDPELDVERSDFYQRMLDVSGTLGANGKFREAEKLLLKLTDLVPDNGFAWSNLGLVYRDWKKYDKSLAAYKKAAELLPYDAQILNDYAVVLDYHFNRTEEAFVLYKKAVEISENVDALENLSRFYLNAGQFEEAVRMADRGLRLEPNRMTLRNYKRRAEQRLTGR